MKGFAPLGVDNSLSRCNDENYKDEKHQRHHRNIDKPKALDVILQTRSADCIARQDVAAHYFLDVMPNGQDGARDAEHKRVVKDLGRTTLHERGEGDKDDRVHDNSLVPAEGARDKADELVGQAPGHSGEGGEEDDWESIAGNPRKRGALIAGNDTDKEKQARGHESELPEGEDEIDRVDRGGVHPDSDRSRSYRNLLDYFL